MTDSDTSSAAPDDEARDDLPVTTDRSLTRRDQNTSLLQAPSQPVKVIVERGAQAYFSTCRRLAKLLNRGDQK